MRLEAGTGKYELVLLKGIGGAAKTADSRVGAEESGCFMVPPLSPGEDGEGCKQQLLSRGEILYLGDD